jgi:hypothetical protein
MTVRREVMLMQYQLVKDYATGAMGGVQFLTSPQVPSEAKKYILQINDISARLLTRIMENFEDTEPDSMVFDIRKSVDVEKCIAQSVDIIAQQQQMSGQMQGQPPGVPAETNQPEEFGGQQ